MSPEQLDNFALKLRDDIKAQVERTGALKLGAVVLATRDPETGQELTEPAVVTVMPLRAVSDQEEYSIFGARASEVVTRTKALAIIIFSGATDGKEPILWVSYERVMSNKARDWHAKVSGNEVSEFTERLSPLAFFELTN